MFMLKLKCHVCRYDFNRVNKFALNLPCCNATICSPCYQNQNAQNQPCRLCGLQVQPPPQQNLQQMRDPVIDQILTNPHIYLDEVKQHSPNKAYTFIAYQVMTVFITILAFQFAVNYPHLQQYIYFGHPNFQCGQHDDVTRIPYQSVALGLQLKELKTDLSSKIDSSYKDYKDLMNLNLHDQRTNLKLDLKEIQTGFLTQKFNDDKKELKEATATINQNQKTLIQQEFQQLKSEITLLMETHNKNYKDQILTMQNILQSNITQTTQQKISSKIHNGNNVKEFNMTEILQSGSLLKEKHLSLLIEWLNIPQMTKLKQLYRGSRDGFGSLDFHRLCDNKGPTVTVILSEHDKLFGGFASISWKSHGENARDDNAFIFSLTHRTKFHLKQDKKQMALYFNSNWGPKFGNDINILNNCNINSDSLSWFGWAYNLPNGIQYGTNEAYGYLAGSYYFKVKEIEVFQVIY